MGRTKRSLTGGSYCCIVNCSNNTKKDGGRGIHFYSFPKEKVKRDQWIQAVRRQDFDGAPWQPSKSARICSKHFIGGKKSLDKESPSYIPKIFPSCYRNLPEKLSLDRYERAKKRRRVKINLQDSSKTETCSTLDDSDYESRPDCSNMGHEEKGDQSDDIPIKLDFGCQVSFRTLQLNECVQGRVFFCDIKSSNEKSTQVDFPSFKEVSMNTTKTKMISRGTATKSSARNEQGQLNMFLRLPESQARAFTGVDSKIINLFCNLCETTILDSPRLCQRAKISLVLAKFKVNCSYEALSGIFGISRENARSTFLSSLDAMFEAVDDKIIWFQKGVVKARMPITFKELYPNTRAVIDCTEVECERPNSVEKRVLFYSSYKGRFTIKYLIAIAPSGEVTFVSKGFGGRATDTEITCNSGFLELLEPGDEVMADKGFPHIKTNLMERGSILIMPPFKKGKEQFSSEENVRGYNVASVRIHVERAIGRLKTFDILKFMSSNLVQHCDKIMKIIAFIANCNNDLVSN